MAHFLLGDPSNWGPVTQTVEGVEWRFREDRRWWAGVRGTTCCLVDTGSWGYYVFRVSITGDRFSRTIESEITSNRAIEAATPWEAWRAWCRDQVNQEARMIAIALSDYNNLRRALGPMG